MEELKPPKPKANLGRKRGEAQGTKKYSTAVKAKISAQRTIREQNKKITKAQTEFHNAKKKKESLLKADDALKGKKSSVLTTDDVESLAPNVQEHIEDNIVFI